MKVESSSSSSSRRQKIDTATLLIAAVTKPSIETWSAYSAYMDGRISASEMQTAILVTISEAVAGGAGAYVGCWAGGVLAGRRFPRAGRWLGSYLGYEAGAALARELLDWYLDGRVVKIDEKLREVLGGVSYNATPEEIKSAFRKVSFHLQPDKGGDEEGAQEEANFCVPMLLENADSDVQRL